MKYLYWFFHIETPGKLRWRLYPQAELFQFSIFHITIRWSRGVMSEFLGKNSLFSGGDKMEGAPMTASKSEDKHELVVEVENKKKNKEKIEKKVAPISDEVEAEFDGDEVADMVEVDDSDPAMKSLPAEAPEVLNMDEIVVKYAGLIDSIIRRKKYGRIHYSTHCKEDLEQEGFIGLMEAAQRYDPTKGPFKNFAYLTIAGKIGDFARKESHTTRTGRDFKREMRVVADKLRQELQREPNEHDIADAMGIPISRVHKMLIAVKGRTNVSIEANTMAGDEETTLPIEHMIINAIGDDNNGDEVERADMLAMVLKGIDQLPRRERRVLKCYFRYGYQLREISEILSISESRVSQIKTGAMEQLREWVFCNIN